MINYHIQSNSKRLKFKQKKRRGNKTKRAKYYDTVFVIM